MTLVFEHSIPGLLPHAANRLRLLLSDKDESSELAQAIRAQLDRAENEYAQNAVDLMHALYHAGEPQPPWELRQVFLTYNYKMWVVDVSPAAYTEWRTWGCELLHEFVDEDWLGDRLIRIDRGLGLKVDPPRNTA
jgi:hypothetical protein